MKLALEFAALLIAFLCFSTALKAFLHLRYATHFSQRRARPSGNMERLRRAVDRVA